MKKSNRKGFTIVELVIVIAVIAILAAVLIPTFSNLIKRANLSNDQSFVKNMNTILLAEGTIDPFKTAGDAIDALNRNGFAGKYEPYTTGYHYCYSLENNKMYLIDEEGEVVYPKDDVDKATLWGLYTDNQNSVVSGVTKYVAMANITNSAHYNEAFKSGTYTIDLNDHFVAVETDLTDVTADNGIVISGPTAGEGTASDYELIQNGGKIQSDKLNTYGELKDGVLTISKKIFTEFVLTTETDVNVIFDDCIFYGEGVQFNDANAANADVVGTLKNCQFIDTQEGRWAILSNISVNVIDCTFTNLNGRGAIQIQEQAPDMEINISGCTFTGNGKEYPMIRFVGTDKDDGKGNDYRYATTAGIKSLTISGCDFVALNKATGILGCRDTESKLYNYTYTGAEGQPTVVKFENNTFAEAIGGKYIVDAGESNLGTLLGASK
ncbi:MAG: prepilin-type N-terminal cleavage/methylation domain-containing protein [Clostridia bacterium]|nr:prepilin-type N-terminal cleavage/methylation domain-containing protein [Clostridia bacterium]